MVLWVSACDLIWAREEKERGAKLNKKPFWKRLVPDGIQSQYSVLETHSWR